MDYKEAISYLNSLSRFGSRPGLTTIQYLLYLIGNPERNLRIIHVAGTNGKGSTSSMLSMGLLKVGYKVGTYTSPHLFSIRERIKINGEDIGKEEFSALVSDIMPYVKKVASKEGYFHPTFFETLTAMAFLYFARKNVDIVVLETGMGGRFDATNVTYPLVSVITHIARDHTNFLGYKLEGIAEEKCGIIKGGIPVVSGPQSGEVKKVIERISKYKGSPLFFSEEKTSREKITMDGTEFLYMGTDGNTYKVKIPLIGFYQVENGSLAIHTGEILKTYWDYNVPLPVFIDGLKEVNWPGRFQIISRRPCIILDGTHNLDGAKRLTEILKNLFPGRRLKLLIGILKDKEYKEMARYLAPFAKSIVVTTPKSDRALSPFILKDVFSEYTDVPTDVIPSPEDAIEFVKGQLSEDDILLITGSFYLIGGLGKYLTGENEEE